MIFSIVSGRKERKKAVSFMDRIFALGTFPVSVQV